MSGVIRPNLTGTLRSGYFYRFDVDESVDDGLQDDVLKRGGFLQRRSPTDTELSIRTEFKESYGVVDSAGFTREGVATSRLKCGHPTMWFHPQTPLDYRIMHGESLGPFVPGIRPYLARREVAEVIQKQQLAGIEILPARILREDDTVVTTDVRAVHAKGRFFDRPMIIEGGENRCPFCGKGQPVCEICGRAMISCDVCDEGMWRSADERNVKPDDPRLIVCPWKERREAVLDGSRWDGGDFMEGGMGPIATWRFIDYLLSIHAAPFVAEPALVWIDNMTPAQLKRLEEIRQPIR